jgi:hypothetical protein
MNKSRKILLTFIFVLLIISIVVGFTYAYWIVKVTETSSNVIKSGCLSINLTDETEAINLQDAYPISDEVAANLKPYTFKIENICNTSISYDVTLEIMDVDNRLASKYIAANFNGEGKKLLSDFTSVEPTYSDEDYKAVEAKELVSGTLDGKSSISYTINLWIDESVEDNEAMDKNFTSKVSITIYKKKATALIDYITTLAKSDTTNLVSDDETDDHNIRYIGSDPDNYLCFDEDCTNGKWRVIGIMNNMTTSKGVTKSLVKIIRATTIGAYKWNSDSINDWTTSSINTHINGDWYTENLTAYDNLVESVVWKLGGATSGDISTISFYNLERGKTVYNGRPTEWTGKLGLMYPSDYGYATSGGTSGRAACLSYNLGRWSSYSACYNNDYIYINTFQWTITPKSSSSSDIFFTFSKYYTTNYYASATSPGEILPVLYLNTGTKILSGDGTSEDPWIIGLE